MENFHNDFPEISKDEKLKLFDKFNNEETKNMNFQQYTTKVYKDLSEIELDIISKLITHDKELISMFNNFNLITYPIKKEWLPL